MTMTFYRRWQDAPERAWRWPNFSPAEIACCGTGKLSVSEPAFAAGAAQSARQAADRPLGLSQPRAHPRRGGATRSKHIKGAAFDIVMANHDPLAFEAAAGEVGVLGFGFYPRTGFMHIDFAPARQWGERFPPSARADYRTKRQSDFPDPAPLVTIKDFSDVASATATS